MNHHSSTLAFLGTEQSDPGADKAIAAAERRLGIKLPDSVHSWYTIQGAVSLLSRQDHFRPLDELELVEEHRRLLVVADENQAVCQWAVEVTSAPDPAVFVNVDDTGWSLYTPTFSEFIFALAWDFANKWPLGGSAQAGALTASDLAVMVEKFIPLVTSFNWPAAVNYRFQTSGGRILLWSAADQCDWLVEGDSETGFLSVLEIIHGLSDLATTR